METVPADYSKRVYQGVRVKHTVKDLLAEKRSRQTSSSRFNGVVMATVLGAFKRRLDRFLEENSITGYNGFVQVPGFKGQCCQHSTLICPIISYYGVRRSLVAEMELPSNKQIPGDIYTSSLLAKPFAYELPAVQGHPLLDSYLIDQYGEHQASTSSLFSSSSVPPSLPPYSSDLAHFLTRDSWEQTVPPDSLSQSDACPDSLQVPSASSCISSPEPGSSSSQYRNPTWNSPTSGSQAYSLHALEDIHYAAGYSATSPYPFPSFMSMASDLTPKMLHTSSEEPSDADPLSDGTSLWPKEEGSPLWGSYECRRTY